MLLSKVGEAAAGMGEERCEFDEFDQGVPGGEDLPDVIDPEVAEGIGDGSQEGSGRQGRPRRLEMLLVQNVALCFVGLSYANEGVSEVEGAEVEMRWAMRWCLYGVNSGGWRCGR